MSDDRDMSAVPFLPPGSDRDMALAMLNQARQRGGIDEVQVEHLLAIGFRAGRADERNQLGQFASDVLVQASNDIRSARAGRRVATPRILTPTRVARWLQDLARTYRTGG